MEMSLNTSGPSYCQSKGEQFAWEADNAAPDDKKFFKRYLYYSRSQQLLFRLISKLVEMRLSEVNQE